MNLLKRWGLTALLILLGMEILTIAPKRIGSPEDSERKADTPSPPPKSAVATISQLMHGVHLVETSKGEKEWELDAETAQGYKDKGTWNLQGVRVKFFGKTNSVYTVTGDTGTIQTETKDMSIHGKVVTTSTNGYVFRTDSLAYKAKEHRLSTSDHVVLTGPKSEGAFELAGRGLDSDLDSNVMLLKEDVRAIKEVPPSRSMNIRSQWARINGKTNEAHFEKGVQVDLDTIRMTGQKADFIYDEKSHTLRSLMMQDNVRVTDQRHWASSQKAYVLFAENEFTLLGNPRVVQDNNELRGEEIHFYNGGKEVQVIKAKARVDNQSDELTRGAPRP